MDSSGFIHRVQVGARGPNIRDSSVSTASQCDNAAADGAVPHVTPPPMAPRCRSASDVVQRPIRSAHRRECNALVEMLLRAALVPAAAA